MVELHYIILKL